MKKVDELNFKPLRLAKIFYVSNRLYERLYKPRRLIFSIPIVMLGLILYGYFIHVPTKGSWTIAVVFMIYMIIVIAINLVFILFLPLLLTGLFKEANNYTLLRKFMKINTLTQLGNEVKGKTYPNNPKSIIELMPPSTRKTDWFQALPHYSFKLLSKHKHEVTLVQFRSNVTYQNASFDRYYLSARVKLRHGKDVPHIYLDSVKNGTSLLKSLAKQSLQLEGEFEEYFMMYHDKDQSGSVREMLTPDTMHFLVNAREPYDIEFKGDYAWIIAKGYHMNEYDLKRIMFFADKCAEIID